MSCTDERCLYRVRIAGPLSLGLAGWLFGRFPEGSMYEGSDGAGNFVIHVPHEWQPPDDDAGDDDLPG